MLYCRQHVNLDMKSESGWAEGLLKPHNHTVSASQTRLSLWNLRSTFNGANAQVSDLGFIAGYHGLATLRLGNLPVDLHWYSMWPRDQMFKFNRSVMCWPLYQMSSTGWMIRMSSQFWIGLTSVYVVLVLRVGEIQEYRSDGQGVLLKEMLAKICENELEFEDCVSRMDQRLIVTSSSRFGSCMFLDWRRMTCNRFQATGFLLNDEVPKISGRKNIHSFDLLDYNLLWPGPGYVQRLRCSSHRNSCCLAQWARYGAEPLLDGAQFGSAKGRVAEEEQVSEEAAVSGFEDR